MFSKISAEPTLCTVWTGVQTVNEEKQESLRLSLTFKEKLMVRDCHPFPPAANVPQVKILEGKMDVMSCVYLKTSVQYLGGFHPQ